MIGLSDGCALRKPVSNNRHRCVSFHLLICANTSAVTDEQYDSIVNSPDAWTIVDVGLDQPEDDSESDGTNFLPTRGARQVKALIDQVLDRYVNLPSIKFRYPFLASIQMPLLKAFQLRIASSLEAFETLSSAFLRAVPGALGPGGVTVDRTGMTSGVTGLQRLTRAWISAAWMKNALRRWDDDPVSRILARGLKLAQLSRLLESPELPGNLFGDCQGSRVSASRRERRYYWRTCSIRRYQLFIRTQISSIRATRRKI